MSGTSPSHSRSSRMPWSNSAVERSRSVSSMRRTNVPPWRLREQRIVQRGADVADVQPPGRRRREAGGDGHRIAFNRSIRRPWQDGRRLTKDRRYFVRRPLFSDQAHPRPGDWPGHRRVDRQHRIRPMASLSAGTGNSRAGRGAMLGRWSQRQLCRLHSGQTPSQQAYDPPVKLQVAGRRFGASWGSPLRH